MVQSSENSVQKSLKRLEEWIVDEGKIVTYKYLSRQLHVHVNTAKQLMHLFNLQSKGDWPDLISCTYLVSGVKSDDSRVVSLVNEKDLSELKKSLKETTSEHVFSLQKMPTVENFQALVGADKFPSDNSISPIQCAECLITRDAPVMQFSTAVPATKKLVAPQVSKKEAKSPVKSKPEPVNAPKATTSGKNVKEDAKEKKQEKPPTKKPAASISSMFSAQNQKPKITIEKKQAEPVAPVKTVEEKSKSDDAKADKVEPKESKKAANTKKDKEPAKKPSKSRKTSKKETAKQDEKKRKRIQVFSDSDDSDEEAVRGRSPSPEPEPETEAMVIGSDKEEEEEVIKAEATSSGHKKKKRKIVDKHVMDEDGFMVTKKEVVFETDSEPEEVPAPTVVEKSGTKKPAEPVKKPAVAAKQTSPVKKGKGKAPAVSDGKKQSSLLSFFKKN